MLQYAVVQARYPAKRAADIRLRDYREIQEDFAVEEAAAQAARCAQCGVPFCQVHCPLSNNIPDWLKLVAEGRLREAFDLAQSTNNMPEICGRICPQDRLCEGSCVAEQSGHRAITIGAIERHLGDMAFQNGWVAPLAPRAPRGQSVGIVGAGPAGLTAAEELCRRGYEVTVYDRHDRAGGLLIYGIPNFKLDKMIVTRRVERLRNGGIEFRLDTEIGRDVEFAHLRQRHDAILLATGAYRRRTIDARGQMLEGVVHGLDFLIAANRTALGDAIREHESGRLNALGKDVVVIGGGDTAMDCVRTAKRQGALSVTCLYRRDRANMPGSAREVRHAEEEGVNFAWLAAPESLDGTGAVAQVRGARLRLADADANGRRGTERLEGVTFAIDAQMVIIAAGFDPEPLPQLFGEPDLAADAGGRIRIDRRRFATSLDGVFAAGDIVRGASLVVWAIRDGRDAASAIHRHLAAVQEPRHDAA